MELRLTEITPQRSQNAQHTLSTQARQSLASLRRELASEFVVAAKAMDLATSQEGARTVRHNVWFSVVIC